MMGDLLQIVGAAKVRAVYVALPITGCENTNPPLFDIALLCSN